MRIIRYLLRSINPLNILLFIILVVVICCLFPLMKINAGYSLPQAKPKIVEEAEIPQEKTANIQPSDYTVIAELNLFHPERRIPVEKKAEEIPKPDVILYGTMIQDSVQYAFIEDKKNPKTTPGRGNRQTTVKKGDIIGGFVISEIQADRITLAKGDEKITVLLADTDKRKNASVTQGPIQTPSTARPGQALPTSPFGPVPGQTSSTPQMGGRPQTAVPTPQPPGAVPQPLPRPAGRGIGRPATGSAAPGVMPTP
jgi:hypothetical protein